MKTAFDGLDLIVRQVPTYLIIGNGRVARHFRHYLSSLSIPYQSWDRSQDPALLQPLARATSHILILVGDAAIEGVALELKTRACKIHFSGSLTTPQAYGAHPLMTFGPELYAPEKYREISFIVDESAPEDILPGLPNTQIRLAPDKKAKYHALCVMAGNFSCLLWQKLFADFKDEMHIDPQAAHPYLRQQMENLMRDYKTALTGPLARGDGATITRNLQALDGDAFRRVYQSFVEAYKEKKPC